MNDMIRRYWFLKLSAAKRTMDDFIGLVQNEGSLTGSSVQRAAIQESSRTVMDAIDQFVIAVEADAKEGEV